MKHTLFFITTLMIFLLLSSCDPERQLANNFIKDKSQRSILLLFPDFSKKFSYKIPDISKFDSLPVSQQDSLLFFNSEILQYLDDSVIFANYQYGLTAGLKSLGFKVSSVKEANNFLNADSEPIVFNLAQLQFEEYYDSINDEVSFGDDETYNYKIYLTSVNINSWFELSRFNHHDSSVTVLYASNNISDRFEGGYQYFPFSGDVKYTYSIDSLVTGDVYSSIREVGLFYSGYLFDYLMNEYVQDHLPGGTLAIKLFTYDRQARVVRKNKGQRFIKIDQEKKLRK